MIANIAHRGGAALWPENTLEAFSQAISMGAAGIEFDLQTAADGGLYVYHDERIRPSHWGAELGRQPATLPRFRDLTRHEIGQLDVSEIAQTGRPAPFSPAAGARVPTFEALLELVDQRAQPSFRLYAELKTDMVRQDEALKLSAAFVDAIRERPDRERFWLVSFDWRCLQAVRQALPDIKNAYTTLPFSETDPDAPADKDDVLTQQIRRASAQGAPWWGDFDWRNQTGGDHGERVIKAIAAAGGQGWFAYWRDITAARAGLAQSLGLSVSAWTVNESHDMTALAEFGVEAIITDRPDRFPAKLSSAPKA